MIHKIVLISLLLISFSFANAQSEKTDAVYEEMTKEFIKVCLEKIAQNPNALLISVSQNDSDKDGTCECPNCLAAEKEDGKSGLMLQFVNKVAAEIKKQYPDILVDTIAYHYTIHPPKKTRPADNVVIRFCPIEANYAQSLEDGPDNAELRKNLKEWSAIAPRLFIWNYVTNFRNYIFPHPNYRNLAKDIRFFIKNNAIGLFEQGDSGSNIGDFVRARAWITQKLLWNPDLDEKKVAEEFFNGYYGAAGPYLMKYIDFLCDVIEASGVRLSCGYDFPDAWLKLEDIQKARKIYAEAEK